MLVPKTPQARRSPGNFARRLALACAGLLVLAPLPAASAPAPAGGDEAPSAGGEAATPSKPTRAPAPPAAKGGAAASDGTRQTEAYGERLDALESEANALKDKIFRSKARLAVLRETVLAGAMAGQRVMLAHRNLMGAGFQLTKIAYYLDGAPIRVIRDDSGSLDQQDEIVVFDGNLAAGRHVVGIELIYKGKGFGAFSYLRGYTFQASSKYELDVSERGAMKVVSVGFERGNITTEMGDRPSVDWQTLTLDASGRPVKGAKGRAASSPAGSGKE